MYTIMKQTIKVKLNNSFTSYSDAVTGLILNAGDEKEVELTETIKDALNSGVLVRVL